MPGIPLMLIRTFSCREADLVVDVVSHLSKVERGCFMLNKPVNRKKLKKKNNENDNYAR